MQKPIAISRHLLSNIIKNIEISIHVAKKAGNGKCEAEFFDQGKKALE